MLRFLEMKYVRTGDDVTILEDKRLGIRTGFAPLMTLNGLNLDDDTINEGLRITLELFREMNLFCEAKHIKFQVLLLPTKENVFSASVQNEIQLQNKEIILKVIENESKIGEVMKRSFEENHISYLDVLGPLRDAITKEAIYPSNEDAHPNKYGYEIIARSVLAGLHDERMSKIR
jgi:hypothetical protein